MSGFGFAAIPSTEKGRGRGSSFHRSGKCQAHTKGGSTGAKNAYAYVRRSGTAMKASPVGKKAVKGNPFALVAPFAE